MLDLVLLLGGYTIRAFVSERKEDGGLNSGVISIITGGPVKLLWPIAEGLPSSANEEAQVHLKRGGGGMARGPGRPGHPDTSDASQIAGFTI